MLKYCSENLRLYRSGMEIPPPSAGTLMREHCFNYGLVLDLFYIVSLSSAY